jgi:hypothetical protein
VSPFLKSCRKPFLTLLALSGVAAVLPVAGSALPAVSGHFMFVWAGDAAKQGKDFLLVIDADPASPNYGKAVASGVTDQQTVRVHHTEYVMPESGMLFANDHDAGRTFVLDVRDPLRPKVAASFNGLAGYAHPHSYLRLPNGHVLATFQHRDHADAHARHGDPSQAGAFGKSGGLVEIDDQGRVVRSASNADPAFPDATLMPYSLVVLPEIDRVVSTNSSMHDDDLLSGVTYQVWRLSDLALLKTAFFDPGETFYGNISPEEPRRGPDGSVFVQTLSCGVQRLSGLETPTPKATLVHTFPGNWCGVPTIVGHYFVQSVPAVHGLVVLDISEPARPREVSRLRLSDTYTPHWTSWDAKTERLVVTSKNSDDRLLLLKLDQATGALSIDEALRGVDGKPGFSFGARAWPHGWSGSVTPHGVVFSR